MTATTTTARLHLSPFLPFSLPFVCQFFCKSIELHGKKGMPKTFKKKDKKPLISKPAVPTPAGQSPRGSSKPRKLFHARDFSGSSRRGRKQRACLPRAPRPRRSARPRRRGRLPGSPAGGRILRRRARRSLGAACPCCFFFFFFLRGPEGVKSDDDDA